MSAYIVGLDGEEKTGKSTLGLTFPKPIANFCFDRGGFERAAWRFPEEVESGDIVNIDIPVPILVSTLNQMSSQL